VSGAARNAVQWSSVLLDALQALAQQVLHGVAAVHTLARHREGFKAPPSSFSVLGIGSGAGQP